MSKRDVMSKRDQIRARRRRQQIQKRVLTIGMMAIGALLIAAALIVPSLTPVEDIVAIETHAFTVPADMNTVGYPDAPVQVDVWEDFQCPGCQYYSQNIEPLIIQNYVETGKVFYTFHHYAFVDSQSATKESQQAANASMCAGEQGRFWDYHDLLFANWNGENQGAFNDKRLIAFADTLGLDMGDFKSCFNKNLYKDQIDQDFQAGVDWGVSSTPSIFVNGQKVVNSQSERSIASYEDIAAAIDTALP